MLSSILTKIGVPVLTTLLGEALGSIDNPITKTAAKALGDVDLAIKQGQITKAQITALEFKTDSDKLAEINKSIRAEIASKDKYVRRMRPTFGYIMALTWAAQMFGIAYIIIFDTQQAGALITAMSSLSAIWGIGLSVLGVYVYKRSEEKKIF